MFPLQFVETILSRFFFSPLCIDAPVSVFTPMNNKTFVCTEGLDDGSGPCSCQDCAAACGPKPVPPPLPPPWLIFGMDAMIVIMWISYSAFLLIFVAAVLGAWCHRCRTSLALNLRPLIGDSDGLPRMLTLAVLLSSSRRRAVVSEYAPILDSNNPLSLNSDKSEQGNVIAFH